MSTASQSRGSISPGQVPQVPHHAPMSERQQLALIKRLELAATASNGIPNNDACMTSPPRAPLQVVNGPNPNGPSTPSNISGLKFSDDVSSSPLCRLGNTPALERLLKKISKRNSKGETPLHTAAIRGSPRLVRQLLVMGADPNAQDHAEWSPLHEACNRGNRGVVRVLLEFGADLNLKGFGKDSPLHDAARNGHIKVVKYLVKSGADIFARNAAGRTPLQESEATLERIDTTELTTTIAYLRDEESRRYEQETSIYSDVSDDDEGDLEHVEDEEREESENEDVAKFLGVAKSSPDVQKAFKSLGLSATKSKSTSVTPLKPIIQLEKRGNSMKHSKNQKSSMVNPNTPKVRLTYEAGLSDRKPSSDGKSLNQQPELGLQLFESESKTRRNPTDELSKKRRTLNEEENRLKKKNKKRRNDLLRRESNPQQLQQTELNMSGENSSMISHDLSGRPVLKVPPLKIILTNSSSNNVTYPTSIDDNGTCNSIIQNTSNYFQEEQETTAEKNLKERKYEWTSKQINEMSLPDLTQTTTVYTTSAAPIITEYPHLKKRKLALLAAASANDCLPVLDQVSDVQEAPLNDIQKFLSLRKQVEQRRKNIFPVLPKPPEGYKDYLMNRKSYLLEENAEERLKLIPKLEPPPSLQGPLRDLFVDQENERYKLRIKQLVEKEKLVLAVEQEILRVHGRAARALANQTLPYSVCTILKDEEIYNPILEQPEDKSRDRDPRSRFNGRIFLSWLQDVDDKWEKIKEQMILRHHNEAESLNAVQKMDWEWTVSSHEGVFSIDDLYIPLVHVSEDFCSDLDRG